MMDLDDGTSSAGLTMSLAIRASNGRMVTVYTRPAYELVDTSGLSAVRATVSAIVSECLYAGMTCSPSQALAAAYSVPDGAPIGMAMLNVGPEPSDAVCERHREFQAQERRNVRAFARGMR